MLYLYTMEIKRLLPVLFLITSRLAIAQQHTILITNNSNIAFENKVIEIPWVAIKKVWPDIDTANIKLTDAEKGSELAFQLEFHGEKEIQHLLVQVSVGPKAILSLNLKKDKHSLFTPRTYCRYVPERKDDFAWENDKIAYRMYGKALEGTADNAYGIDVWTKRTSDLIINEWYKNGDYHSDHGKGLDYYSVGFSLGAGDIAPYINDSVWYSKNYRQWKILDNGPLRSSFRLTYNEWDAAGITVKVSKNISIDAGSQLSRVEANYNYNRNETLPVVMGIVERDLPGALLLQEQKSTMAYWEPEHDADGTTGTGIVSLQPVKKIINTGKQLLMQTDAKKNKPVVYYTGAVWDKAGDIKNASSWFQYIDTFKKQLEEPLTIEVK